MTARTKWTDKKRDEFLTQLAKDPNIAKAAESVGMSRRYMYNLRDDDEEFAELWDEAIEISTDILEAEARRRALHGVPEFKTYQGALVLIPVRDEKGQLVENQKYDKELPHDANNPDCYPYLREPLVERKYSDRMTELLLKAHRPDKFKDRVEHEQIGKVRLLVVEPKMDDDA